MTTHGGPTREPWLARALGGLAVLAFVALAFTPLPHAMHAAFRATASRLEPADAIVVLGAGAEEGYLSDHSLRRAVHGIRLFHHGLAPVIVLHGPPRGGSTPEATARRDLARDLGVPPDAIVLASGRTTREEAGESWRRLGSAGRARILLVTGSHHMWRARALFERQGFEVLPAPVDEVAPTGSRPEQRLGAARSVLQEGLARLIYRLAGAV
jgi:uncharacterized SAM-binding protein YcdF (DUF218 family)